MNFEKDGKDRKKLTKGPGNDDNQTTFQPTAPSSEPDPRIIALVQFLARRAAERDFRQLIEESRPADPTGDDKGRIQ